MQSRKSVRLFHLRCFEWLTPIERALAGVAADFPFKGYLEASPRAHEQIAETVARLLPDGGRILDFAAGPLDKTAVLQRLGYACTAYDDLADAWHSVDGNREKILDFAAHEGIDYHVPPAPIPAGPFEMVMAHDVLEHLHDSPRGVLNELVSRLAHGGYLFVTVPNAGNARKRAALLRGRTNLPDFAFYYWFEGPWRGHVREYVRGDLSKLASFTGLDVIELRGVHHNAHLLPRWIRLPYLGITAAFDGLRDSWLFVARKPAGWMPANKPAPELERALLLAASPYWTLDE
jgi:SAM-dependent methyltransferase